MEAQSIRDVANMKLLLFILVLCIFSSCTGQSSAQRDEANAGPATSALGERFIWTEITPSANWSKSYNYQMFSHHGHLWVFHPGGFWSSPNGRDWTRSELPNKISNQAFLDYVRFKDAIYGLGYFEGNIERFTFRPEIYRTTDMRRWETISKTSNLPHRFFYHPFVFDDKIWIIGGEDKERKWADIWNSSDGVKWTKQKENLAFGPRSNSQIVELNGRLYLLNNDVWTSRDALNWERVTESIVKGEEIFGYTAVVFDSKIWLLGCNRNGQFSSEVLVSSDGRMWQPYEAPWSPRGGIAAAVFNGKIYMTGGKYGGTPDQVNFIYSNDIWTLDVRIK